MGVEGLISVDDGLPVLGTRARVSERVRAVRAADRQSLRYARVVQSVAEGAPGNELRPRGVPRQAGAGLVGGKDQAVGVRARRGGATQPGLSRDRAGAADGNFYGTTPTGGANSTSSNDYGLGTVFKITPAGTLTTLHSFLLKDGHYPEAALIQAADGNLYGTTSEGGANGYGTVFKITTKGIVKILHNFDYRDGGFLYAGLVQATDGNFYGTAVAGGCPQSQSGDCGTIFKVTADGTLSILHTFQAFGDGSNPYAGLLQSTSGTFYGTASFGGLENCYDGGCGTVFSLSVGLRPFVSLGSVSGKVGQIMQIFGQRFTGATEVRFHGTPATFTVRSDTYLTATVPAGASSGLVSVTVPGVSLQSNKVFRITPQVKGFTPTSGPVGTSVVIIGESLTGATEVVFACGKKATFTVDSDTQITAIVPTGAMDGKINIATPGGAATNAAGFTVTRVNALCFRTSHRTRRHVGLVGRTVDPTKGSRAISFQVRNSVRPMHLFGPQLPT